LRAKKLTKNVLEICGVFEAIRHGDIVLNRVWDLHERTAGYRDSIVDLDWGSSTDE
jgi:hypothetical protein